MPVWNMVGIEMPCFAVLCSRTVAACSQNRVVTRDAEQEIVFIGAGMDEAAIVKLLDAALLDDAEMVRIAAIGVASVFMTRSELPQPVLALLCLVQRHVPMSSADELPLSMPVAVRAQPVCMLAGSVPPQALALRNSAEGLKRAAGGAVTHEFKRRAA